MNVGGTHRQGIGHWGESQVIGALGGHDFIVRKIDEDTGEDFSVELGGHGAAATEAAPRLAYLQVKAHAAPCASDVISEHIDRRHLHRWASHQIPVFLVVVAGHGQTPRFFVCDIDEYLAAHTSILDPGNVQKSFAVDAGHAANLGAMLRDRIGTFYATDASRLRTLDAVDVANHHLEIVEEQNDTYPLTPVRIDVWRAIYKSPARPANLRAIVDFVGARARARAGGRRAAQVTCFLFRSLAARDTNDWVARIVWRELDHPAAPAFWSTEQSIELKSQPAGFGVQRAVAHLVASADECAAHLRGLAYRADALAQRLLVSPDARLWPPPEVAELASLAADAEAGPRAPPQLRAVAEFMRAFLRTLDDHRWAVLDDPEATPERRARRSDRALARLRGFHGAVALLLEQAGFRGGV